MDQPSARDYGDYHSESEQKENPLLSLPNEYEELADHRRSFDSVRNSSAGIVKSVIHHDEVSSKPHRKSSIAEHFDGHLSDDPDTIFDCELGDSDAEIDIALTDVYAASVEPPSKFAYQLCVIDCISDAKGVRLGPFEMDSTLTLEQWRNHLCLFAMSMDEEDRSDFVFAVERPDSQSSLLIASNGILWQIILESLHSSSVMTVKIGYGPGSAPVIETVECEEEGSLMVRLSAANLVSPSLRARVSFQNPDTKALTFKCSILDMTHPQFTVSDLDGSAFVRIDVCQSNEFGRSKWSLPSAWIKASKKHYVRTSLSKEDQTTSVILLARNDKVKGYILVPRVHGLKLENLRKRGDLQCLDFMPISKEYQIWICELNQKQFRDERVSFFVVPMISRNWFRSDQLIRGEPLSQESEEGWKYAPQPKQKGHWIVEQRDSVFVIDCCECKPTEGVARTKEDWKRIQNYYHTRLNAVWSWILGKANVSLSYPRCIELYHRCSKLLSAKSNGGLDLREVLRFKRGQIMRVLDGKYEIQRKWLATACLMRALKKEQCGSADIKALKDMFQLTLSHSKDLDETVRMMVDLFGFEQLTFMIRGFTTTFDSKSTKADVICICLLWYNFISICLDNCESVPDRITQWKRENNVWLRRQLLHRRSPSELVASKDILKLCWWDLRLRKVSKGKRFMPLEQLSSVGMITDKTKSDVDRLNELLTFLCQFKSDFSIINDVLVYPEVYEFLVSKDHSSSSAFSSELIEQFATMPKEITADLTSDTLVSILNHKLDSDPKYAECFATVTGIIAARLTHISQVELDELLKVWNVYPRFFTDEIAKELSKKCSFMCDKNTLNWFISVSEGSYFSRIVVGSPKRTAILVDWWMDDTEHWDLNQICYYMRKSGMEWSALSESLKEHGDWFSKFPADSIVLGLSSLWLDLGWNLSMVIEYMRQNNLDLNVLISAIVTLQMDGPEKFPSLPDDQCEILALIRSGIPIQLITLIIYEYPHWQTFIDCPNRSQWFPILKQIIFNFLVNAGVDEEKHIQVATELFRVCIINDSEKPFSRMDRGDLILLTIENVRSEEWSKLLRFIIEDIPEQLHKVGKDVPTQLQNEINSFLRYFHDWFVVLCEIINDCDLRVDHLLSIAEESFFGTLIDRFLETGGARTKRDREYYQRSMFDSLFSSVRMREEHAGMVAVYLAGFAPDPSQMGSDVRSLSESWDASKDGWTRMRVSEALECRVWPIFDSIPMAVRNDVFAFCHINAHSRVFRDLWHWQMNNNREHSEGLPRTKVKDMTESDLKRMILSNTDDFFMDMGSRHSVNSQTVVDSIDEKHITGSTLLNDDGSALSTIEMCDVFFGRMEEREMENFTDEEKDAIDLFADEMYEQIKNLLKIEEESKWNLSKIADMSQKVREKWTELADCLMNATMTVEQFKMHFRCMIFGNDPGFDEMAEIQHTLEQGSDYNSGEESKELEMSEVQEVLDRIHESVRICRAFESARLVHQMTSLWDAQIKTLSEWGVPTEEAVSRVHGNEKFKLKMNQVLMSEHGINHLTLAELNSFWESNQDILDGSDMKLDQMNLVINTL